MQRAVYVIGHRNPDTDSICSAIAYAHLKETLGEQNVRAARAGELDPETTVLTVRHAKTAAQPVVAKSA